MASFFGSLLKSVFGSQQQRDISRIAGTVEKIRQFAPSIQKLDDQGLMAKTDEFRSRLSRGERLDDLLPEAFACVREAAARTIGLRHYDVQMIGGVVLHGGNIAEMGTGEGKTLVATLPLYLNALAGNGGCYLVTVNDYLARRDAEWMGPVYNALGLDVGVIQSGMTNEERAKNYSCAIVYGTNAEFGFDYLRDNMVVQKEKKVQVSRRFAIVDEVDSILIDEARTPLIISGPSGETTDLYRRVDVVIPRLKPSVKKKNDQGQLVWDQEAGEYAHDEKEKVVTLTNKGVRVIEEALGIDHLYRGDNVVLIHHVNQALKAHIVFRRDRDYIVQSDRVVIVDENTGRAMASRRYSDGLHQALEAKENLLVEGETQTYASVTLQNYFRMFEKLSGMTGTADTEAEEFRRIYNLRVIVIPPNVRSARHDHEDRFFLTEDEKFESIANQVLTLHKKGQPILVGTISVEKSEKLSASLHKRGVKHAVLNAKHHENEANIIKDAGLFGSVTIATNMAGRGTDIQLDEESRKAGGLAVIGSERHDSRRIDNQLRGRSSRQGDPGDSFFFVSIEDHLIKHFASPNLGRMLRRLGMKDGEPIEQKMLSKAIARAQRKVEDRNFDMRKHLLEYDDVMNRQRERIYRMRDEVLFDHDLRSEVELAINEVTDGEVSDFLDDRRAFTAESYQEFSALMLSNYGLVLPDGSENMHAAGAVKELCVNVAQKQYQEKRDEIGPEEWPGVERFIFIEAVDRRWKEHLFQMDALKEGIHLRAYQQVQPLTEYKREGHQLFETTIYRMRAAVLSQIFRVKVSVDFDDAMKHKDKPKGKASHRQAGQFETTDSFGQTQGQSPGGRNKGRVVVTAPRRVQKVGRNEPCPCGSGKKYKSCHGKAITAVDPPSIAKVKEAADVSSGRT